MFGISLPRILSWIAFAVALINAAIVQLTQMLADYPGLAKVIAVLSIIAGLLAPFLPRAQGRPEGK